jgi:hypothetical protein
MKTYLRNLIILLAIGCLSLGGARAGENKVEILSADKLASIQGGFCPFETCEDLPGSGVCQPVIAIANVICGATQCTFVPFGFASGCLTAGPVTCTGINTYRQCILAFKLSFCSYGADQRCGLQAQGDCYPVGRVCVCQYHTVGPCDWTDCVP